MKKKKIVSLIVFLSTLVVLLASTTIAFATGSFDDLVFRDRSDDNASLEIISTGLVKNTYFDPKAPITKVTDYEGNSVDISNVDISSIVLSNLIGTDAIEVSLNDIINADGNIKALSTYDGKNYNRVTITYKYSYTKPSKIGNQTALYLDKNTIEKQASFFYQGF